MKIAIINIGMHGHVNPTLGITEGLDKKGHEVLYFCSDELKNQIQSTGASYIPYGSTMGKFALEHAKNQSSAPQENRSFVFLDHILKDCRNTLPEMINMLSEIQPDIILYDFISLTGRLVAEHLKIPAVKFFTSYAINDKFNPFAKSQSMTPPPDVLSKFNQNLLAICSENQCQPINFNNMMTHTEKLNLVFMPKSFQLQNELFDSAYSFVGPCLRSYDLNSLKEFKLHPTKPLLLISLGTLFNAWTEFYKMCFAAFSESPFQVVLSVGPHVTLKDLGEIPANFTIRPHLPQLALLEAADVFISHGGMNSTMEALHFGVPLVAIPQMEEQEMTARRLEELNLGMFLKRSEVTAKQLRDTVDAMVANDTLKKNVLAVQTEIKNAGGIRKAIDLIERSYRKVV